MAQADQGPGAAVIPAGATHVLMYRINFSEGEPEDGVLGFGTPDECERMRESVPAISYSGDREATGAQAAIVPLKPAGEGP